MYDVSGSIHVNARFVRSIFMRVHRAFAVLSLCAPTQAIGAVSSTVLEHMLASEQH